MSTTILTSLSTYMSKTSSMTTSKLKFVILKRLNKWKIKKKFRGGSCPGGKCTKVGGGRCHKNRGGRCHKNGGGKCPGGKCNTTSSCCKSVFLSPMSDTKTQFLYSFPGSSHVFFLFHLLISSFTHIQKLAAKATYNIHTFIYMWTIAIGSHFDQMVGLYVLIYWYEYWVWNGIVKATEYSRQALEHKQHMLYFSLW